MEELEYYSDIVDYSMFLEELNGYMAELTQLVEVLESLRALIEVIYWSVVVFLTIYFMYKFVKGLFRF